MECATASNNALAGQRWVFCMSPVRPQPTDCYILSSLKQRLQPGRALPSCCIVWDVHDVVLITSSSQDDFQILSSLVYHVKNMSTSSLQGNFRSSSAGSNGPCCGLCSCLGSTGRVDCCMNYVMYDDNRIMSSVQGHFQIILSRKYCPLFRPKLDWMSRLLYCSGVWSYIINAITTPIFMAVHSYATRLCCNGLGGFHD